MQTSRIVFETANHLHADHCIDDPLFNPCFNFHPHRLVAGERCANADHQSLCPPLLIGRFVADYAYRSHPFGQRLGVLGDLCPPDKRRIIAHIQLNAIGRIIADEFRNHRQPVCPYLRYGKRQPIGIIALRGRIVGLLADAPLGMPRRKIGDPAICDAIVWRMQHIQ